MKFLGLILAIVIVLMVQQGQSVLQEANSIKNIYNNFFGDKYSDLLLSSGKSKTVKKLRSQLKKIKKQAIPTQFQNTTHNRTKAPELKKIQKQAIKTQYQNTTHNSTKEIDTGPKNCADVLKRGGKNSGVYTVDPDGKGPFKVYCDQKTTGGGWTVFQKRKDGSVNFYRGWNAYKNGFGNLKGEFWLGLDKINRLTHQARNRLRVDLEDIKGKTAYAEYVSFAVANEKNKYRLSLGKYSGTAGNSLKRHNGMAFSTKDRDNDIYSKHCAQIYKGGWWYDRCHSVNLNGRYLLGKNRSDSVLWSSWRGYHSLKRAEMKFRPV